MNIDIRQAALHKEEDFWIMICCTHKHSLVKIGSFDNDHAFNFLRSAQYIHNNQEKR